MVLSKKVIRILYGLLLLAFIFASINLCKIKPVSCDEIFSYFHAKGGSYHQFMEQTESGFNRMPPFYFFATKVLFSETDFIFKCRILSLLFALTGVCFLYKISRLWLDEEISLLVSVSLLLGSLSFLEYSIDARPYALCFALLTVFIFQILKFESKQRNGILDKFVLFILCAFLPASHYLYGLTAAFVGLAHVYLTKNSKWLVFKIYLCSSIVFITFHLDIFLEQRGFGNLLMMIAFPDFLRIGSYLAGLISIPHLVLVLVLWPLIYGKFKKPLQSYDVSEACLMPVIIGLFVLFLFGVLIARIFPEHIWFLPRYYLGTILTFPFLIIFVLTTIKPLVGKLKTVFLLIFFFVTSYIVFDSYKHRKYYFENDTLHTYQSILPQEISSTDLPICTEDIILFSYYIYAGKKIYYINSDKKILTRMRSFFPSQTDCFISEIKQCPCIFLNIGNANPVVAKGVSFEKMDVGVGPIHSAYHLY